VASGCSTRLVGRPVPFSCVRLAADEHEEPGRTSRLASEGQGDHHRGEQPEAREHRHRREREDREPAMLETVDPTSAMPVPAARGTQRLDPAPSG
jgi:hypothetical protein